MDKENAEENRKARRSGAQIEELIDLYRQSGLTQKAFAADYGINVETMRGWLYRRRGRRDQPEARLVPVRLAEPNEAGVFATLRLPNGVEVIFHRPVEVAQLLALIRAGASTC